MIVTSVFYHTNILSNELARRKKKNPRYSMRAFARHLDIDASVVSRIMSGKQTLSLPMGLSILSKLDLPLNEKRQFLLSIGEEMHSQVTALLNRSIEAAESRQAS